MSFIASISVSQNYFGQVEVTDTSDYTVETHAAFISRQLLVYKSDGTLLVISPAFSFANYPSNKIIISVKKDYCLKIIMVLTPTTALMGSKYSATEIRAFSYYAKESTVQMGLSMLRHPLMRSDDNFYSKMERYYVNLKMADLAADNLQQIASQVWLDKMGQTTAITQLADQSVVVSQQQDQVISIYSFEATGSEGATFAIPSLIGRKIMWFFRDDPKPLRQVTANPIVGQFTFTPSMGGFKMGVELQAREFIQIQHTSQ